MIVAWSSVRVALATACLATGFACRPGTTAGAAPLPPEACEVAKAEHKTLVDGGIPEIVKKGPAWAKSNVSAAKLKDVERYIGLQEQLQFRCGLAKLRELPIVEDDPADVADPARAAKEGEAAAAAELPPPLPAKPKAKAQPKPSPLPARATAPAKAAEASPAAEPAPKPKAKPKPKPKADDAFRPPAKPETGQD